MAGMTSRTWAGIDPDDGVNSSVPAAPADRPPTPPVAAEAADRPGPGADLDGAVRSIGVQALKANLRRARDLDEAVRLATRGELADDRRMIAVKVAHQLDGSAGTFGFPGASDRAGELERFFGQAVFDQTQLRRATGQVTALFAELAGQADYGA